MALQKGDALCTSGLAKRIHDVFVAYGFTTSADVKAFCHALAGAVIDEITTNATVLPTLLVAPTSGGPVTGTGKVE